MLARAAGDSPSFVKLPVNHATTASGLNHHDYHSHTNKPPRRASQPHRAPHPQQGTAPVMWRCTSYVALHPFRTGALPTDRVQRPHSQAQPWTTAPRAPTSTQRQQAQHNETTAAPARMADNTPSRTTSPTYRIEDSTLFEYKPHRTRAQTRKHTPNPSPQPSVVGRRKPQKIDSPRPP